jgi:hypothetical protein
MTSSVEPRATVGPVLPGLRVVTLHEVHLVPWEELEDVSGPAAAIPYLLAAVASEDPFAAHEALERLRDRICRHGCVVAQATAYTVPFLWDLVRRPATTCRPELLYLLQDIAQARMWEATVAPHPRVRARHAEQLEWEAAARRAVQAQRHVVPTLLREQDEELVDATLALASTLTG